MLGIFFFARMAIKKCKKKKKMLLLSCQLMLSCSICLPENIFCIFTYSLNLLDFKYGNILEKQTGFNIYIIKLMPDVQKITVGCGLWLHGWLTCSEKNVTQLQKPSTFPTMWKEIMDFTGSLWAHSFKWDSISLC